MACKEEKQVEIPISENNHGLTEAVTSCSVADRTWVRLYRDTGHNDTESRKRKKRVKTRKTMHHSVMIMD